MTNYDQVYDIRAMRKLLTNAFIDIGALRRFCRERAELRPVLGLVNEGAGKDVHAETLIAYCESQLLWDELLAGVEQVNPRQYTLYEPSIRSFTHRAGKPTYPPQQPIARVVEPVASEKSRPVPLSRVFEYRPLTPTVVPRKRPENGPSVADVYRYVLLCSISASATFSAALIFRPVCEGYSYGNPTSILGSLASLVASSDFFYVIVSVCMILGGAGLWLVIDSLSRLKHAALLQRIPPAAILGFIGAWLGLVVVPLLAFLLLGKSSEGISPYKYRRD